MKIEFNYILENHGWATGSLYSREFQTEFDASYLHDSLDSIILGAIGLLTDRRTATIPFFSEPGEHQLIIEKIDNEKIEIELRWFDDWVTWNLVSADKYDSIFKGQTTLKSFVDSAYKSAKKILDEYGQKGYFESWRSEFPMDKFVLLEKLIKNTNAQKKL